MNGRVASRIGAARSLALWIAGVLALAVVAAVALRGSRGDLVLAEGKGLEGSDSEVLQQVNRANERIAEAVTPSIVNIQTTQVVKVQQSPFFSDPFFRQFFGLQPFNIPREQREHALGSGVIVSADGSVVTNNHVIAHATEIQVMLQDSRTFKGKVIGADPQTDVAVLKVDARSLPVAHWGDSSTLKPGDQVMAFGNPFGLNFTVTRGIVSAIGRSGLGIESFEDFIQTDAPINPGNSGGALVDLHGRVVGINTAIVSPGAAGGEGGFSGVGFAIPSNVVKRVMENLVKTGKVVRGYLGVEAADLSQAMARQFKVPDISGALVNEVTPGSPADKAGLKPGDVIRSIDDRRVASASSLTFLVTASPPGTEVTLGVLRDGKHVAVKVKLGTRPAELAVAAGRGRAPAQGTLRGITVQDLSPALRSELGLPGDLRGVAITNLDPSSPAAQEGLQAGDVIMDVDRTPVRSVVDFERLAGRAKGEVLLRIYRQGTALFVALSPLEG